MSGTLVRIPTPLRRVTNGQDKVEIDGNTVGQIIESMDSSYPGFKERLVDEDGEINTPIGRSQTKSGKMAAHTEEFQGDRKAKTEYKIFFC